MLEYAVQFGNLELSANWCTRNMVNKAKIPWLILLFALLFFGESCFGHLFDGLKTGRVGVIVQEFMTSLPADTSVGHKLRLQFQEKVKLVCVLRKSSDVTDDMVAGCMK